jgi:hypothetical protein
MIGRKRTIADTEVTVSDACEFGDDDGPEAFKGVCEFGDDDGPEAFKGVDEAGGNGGSITSETFKTGSGARAGG